MYEVVLNWFNGKNLIELVLFDFNFESCGVQFTFKNSNLTGFESKLTSDLYNLIFLFLIINNIKIYNIVNKNNINIKIWNIINI